MGLKLYGGRALMSLRSEKSWGVWTLDFRPDFTASESGLDAFIAFDKDAEFIGKTAAIQQRADGPTKKLVTLTIDTKDIDCHHDEAVFHRGDCVGYVTSGGFAHHVQKSVAMAYVPIELAVDQTAFEVEILGEMYAATLQAAPLYDPQGNNMRS